MGTGRARPVIWVSGELRALVLGWRVVPLSWGCWRVQGWRGCPWCPLGAALSALVEAPQRGQ